MHSSKKELLAVLQKVQGVSVLVVGDIILDRYIWGGVNRISPEAPVPVVNVKRVEDRLGGAGNAVNNLLRMGANVSLCGVIGDDQEGKKVLELLQEDEVNREGIMIDRGSPTSLKTRVIAQSQQVVRIDREDPSDKGVALREGLAALVDEQINSVQAVIISDYGKGTISDSIMTRISAARQAKRLGLKVRPVIVDPHPRNFDIYQGITIAKPNRKEAEAACGAEIADHDSAIVACRQLMERWEAEMMMITLGEDGLVIVTPEDSDGICLETVAQEVFDVSGAGDTVTAVVTLALAVGAPPVVAGDLANIAAGIVVSEVGTVPIEFEQLKQAVEGLE